MRVARRRALPVAAERGAIGSVAAGVAVRACRQMPNHVHPNSAPSEAAKSLAGDGETSTLSP